MRLMEPQHPQASAYFVPRISSVGGVLMASPKNGILVHKAEALIRFMLNHWQLSTNPTTPYLGGIVQGFQSASI